MNKPFPKVAAKAALNVAAACSVLLAVSGCMTEDVKQKIAEREPTIIGGVARAEAPADKVNYNPLIVTDKVWTGDRSVRMRRGLPLPATYEGAKSVSLISNKPMTLPDLAMFISQQTGVPVRLVDGAEKVTGGPNGGSAAAAGAGAAGTPSAPQNVALGLPVAAAAPVAETATDNGGMKVAYQGPLSAFLDSLSSYFGVNWRYDGSAIIVSRFETRTFTVEAMGSTAEFSDGISGGGDTGGSSGGSGSSGGGSSGGASKQTGTLDQTNKFGGKVDYWGELQESVNTILSGVGTVKTSPSSGTVTVITTPEIMRTVAQYVDQENARSTKQVAITLELFTLTLDNSENITTQLRLLYTGGNITGTGGGLAAVTPVASAGSSFGVSIIDPQSNFNGSGALIQALSSIGKVSRVAKIPLTTLNNRPATRRIGQDIAYVASVSNSTGTGSDVTSQAINPATIAEGFSLQVTPRILGDSRILVQFSLSVLDLVALKPFGTGVNQIQLPTTASRVFVQQAMLNNGDTLVLAGFDQDRQSTNNSGFGNPFNILFGGNISSGDSREVLFLTLTPREIDVPRRMPISGAQ